AIIEDRPGLRALRTMDWIQSMAFCSSELAWRDANFTGTVDPERLGVYLGVGRGGADAVQRLGSQQLRSFVSDPEAIAEANADPEGFMVRSAIKAVLSINPVDYLQQCPCLTSAYVAARRDARGPTLTNVNLCSASAQSIGEAAWVINRGDADVMIAG